MYGLTSQLRRAVASVPTNISEGCGRSTDADFARFIHIALGSAHETEYLLQLAFDLNYLLEADFNNFNSKINTIKRKLFQLNKTLL